MIRVSGLPGPKESYCLWALTGGGRQIRRVLCPICKVHFHFTHRDRPGVDAHDLGADPEVLGPAVHALLEQSEVHTFLLDIEEFGIPQQRKHCIVPRHHLPTFTAQPRH